MAVSFVGYKDSVLPKRVLYVAEFVECLPVTLFASPCCLLGFNLNFFHSRIVETNVVEWTFVVDI